MTLPGQSGLTEYRRAQSIVPSLTERKHVQLKLVDRRRKRVERSEPAGTGVDRAATLLELFAEGMPAVNTKSSHGSEPKPMRWGAHPIPPADAPVTSTTFAGIAKSLE